jgi:hypothetical protein
MPWLGRSARRRARTRLDAPASLFGFVQFQQGNAGEEMEHRVRFVIIGRSGHGLTRQPKRQSRVILVESLVDRLDRLQVGIVVVVRTHRSAPRRK